jgi:long-subunit acyl-CoA synthetase (AMP-forming)
MTLLWEKIEQYASSQAALPAIVGLDKTYSWLELYKLTIEFAQQLQTESSKAIAFYADNSPAWVIVDLACQMADVTLLPLPAFFSDQQIRHAIKEAGVTGVLHHNGDRLSTLLALTDQQALTFSSLGLVFSEIEQPTVLLPKTTAKITFTSGSTGHPKGVCLSNDQQLRVATSLLSAIELIAPRHLSILPFSTLLENIGGIYSPLLGGGTIIALPPSSLGFNGSNGFELNALLAAISQYQPNSMILLPELLMALVAAISKGWQPPSSLKFIAVGGSKVSPSLLERAHELGLPVYEGYGLSECSSVVSLNSPSDMKLGTIGKVLPHLNVSIEQGEIVVTGNAFLGYINEPNSWSNSKVYTGDLGRFDENNYLHINGRKKNLLISSYGRNINPEWVESELLSSGLLSQVVVFGDAKPYCVALLYPRDSNTSDEMIQVWIDSINQTLPSYAQIKQWTKLTEAMSFNNGLLTSNGRPVRDKIMHHYLKPIEQLYAEDFK